jgi:hypothetical protein
MAGFDKLTERFTRSIARGTSRRSLLARLGAGIAGAAAIPALPVARAATHGGGITRRFQRQPARPGRPRLVRLLALLRDRRFPVHLLRRLGQHLPAGHRNVARDVDRHLHQPGRQPRLYHQLQRLLRHVFLRAMPVQQQCGRSPQVRTIEQ